MAHTPELLVLLKISYGAEISADTPGSLGKRKLSE
jgi:hypothetical protein